MNYYRFPNTRFNRVGFVVFLLVMHMLSRTSMVSSAFLGFYHSQFLTVGLIGVAGIAFLYVNRKNMKQVFADIRMVAVIGIIALMVFSMVVKQDFQMLYFSILLYILFALFLSYFVTLKEAAKMSVRNV